MVVCLALFSLLIAVGISTVLKPLQNQTMPILCVLLPDILEGLSQAELARLA